MATQLLTWIGIGLIATPAFAQEGEVIQDKDGNKIELVESDDQDDLEDRTHLIQAGDRPISGLECGLTIGTSPIPIGSIRAIKFDLRRVVF
jgi:hypothetical protein